MANKELAVVESKETRLAHPMEFSSDQVRLLGETVAKGCDQNELAFFLNVCKLKRLDPFTSQVHCVKRWDNELRREKMVIQIGIDGFRVTAARSGELAGSTEPEYDTEEEEHPNWARVTVFRYGRDNEKIAYTAKARWGEYVQMVKDKDSGQFRPNRMWAKMPYVMLGKCAEALALRKAFPDELSGMYSDEEMGQADNDTQEGHKAPKPPVSMPKSTDDKPSQGASAPKEGHTATGTTTRGSTTGGSAAETSQQAPRVAVQTIEGVIEKTQMGTGKQEGCLFLVVDSKVIRIPKDKVNAEMVDGARVLLKAVPNSTGKVFEAREVELIQPAVIEGEIVEEEAEDETAGLGGLFDDEAPQRPPQTKTEPDPPPAPRKGTIGTKRAQRLYALRRQYEKQTNLTEDTLKEILSKLPIPIEHLSDLETNMYETFEQIVQGEEDWRPYLD